MMIETHISIINTSKTIKKILISFKRVIFKKKKLNVFYEVIPIYNNFKIILKSLKI